MEAMISTLLTLIRPRDRERVGGFLAKIAADRFGADGGYLTVVRVGAGGEETQSGRWEPADGVSCTEWLVATLRRLATESAPASAKFRARRWEKGGKNGPGVTAVLEPVEVPAPATPPALPAPALAVQPVDPRPLEPAPSTVADLERGLAECESHVATLQNKLAVSDEARRWYEKAWQDEQTARRAIERELRQTHAALAQALADGRAVQRDYDRMSTDLRDARRDLRKQGADLARVQRVSDRWGDRVRELKSAARETAEERREEEQALDEIFGLLGIDDEE